MKDVLHKTLIGTIREHVIAWRKAEGWSRETVVQTIIEAHEVVGSGTGIVFDPQTNDLCERREVNAQRVFRWLDDESKESNLLPSNFIPSILAAMPIDRRMACVSELLVPLGLGVRLLDDEADDKLDINDIFEAQMAHGDALQAATLAIQNPTPENLEAADLKMSRAEKRNAWLRKKIAGAKKAVSGTKAFIGRIVHRKEKVTQ
jgi:hypothetical protein